jgi:hypothetical protein
VKGRVAGEREGNGEGLLSSAEIRGEKKRKGKRESRAGREKERERKEKKEGNEKKGRERINLTLVGQIFCDRNRTVICASD